MCSDCFLCLFSLCTFFIFKILRITAHARDGVRPSLVGLSLGLVDAYNLILKVS
jgi:hypothetical protein